MSIQDVNHLTISGHVNQPPRLDDDGDAIVSCEFVLTHNAHGRHAGSLQQHYRVSAHDDVTATFAVRYEPGQTVIVLGRLELEIHDTLLGPLPAISITAHRIIPINDPRDPAAAGTVTDPQQVLAYSASRPARPQRSRR